MAGKIVNNNKDKVMAKKNQATEGLKKTLGGTKRDDRQAGDKYTFEPITIDIKNALTVIYMLKSPEDNVVLRGVASLEKFGKKATENLVMLSSLGIFEYLLPLVHHGDYLIKRFAQKLIGMLCSAQEFRDQMLKVENILKKFLEVLEKENDMVMHEFSALTLTELTKECDVTNKFIKIPGSIDILFQRITSHDPDVQKNCLDIMINVLNDMEGLDYFLKSSTFDIKSFLNLTSSSFPAIQTQALQILNQLTGWNMDERVLFAFRDALGIETIIGILENQDWKDLHVEALEIIINVADNPVLCDYLLQSGCLAKCINILDECSDKFCIEKLLGVLARMSQTEANRNVLYRNQVEDRFMEYLHRGWDNAWESCMIGIANMSYHLNALNNIMEQNPVPEILAILSDEGKNWNLRHLAAHALHILAMNDQRTCCSLMENQRYVTLLSMIRNNQKMPADTCVNVIYIFKEAAAYEKCRLDLINEDLMGTMLDCIQDPDSNLIKPAAAQLAALECLSKYLTELNACTLFNDLGGAEKILGCLKNKYASIRQWGAQIIIQASQDQNFVKKFIYLKGLEWLIEGKSNKFAVPSWELAIDAIFNVYLPAKFAFTGCLEINNITDEGFYILRHQRKEFLNLEELLQCRVSPIRPIYVANFNNLPKQPKDDFDSSSQSYQSGSTPDESQKQEQGDHEKSPSKEPCLIDPQKMEEVIKLSNEKFSKPEPDRYLPEYLEKLKKRIIREESFKGDPKWFCINPDFVLKRAKILAQFVADQMAGPEPYQPWNQGYQEQHLNDIKLQLGTNIIPLGYVRYGSYLERAMLFKVLADKIGLPCALERGRYGRAWVEIAIPLISDKSSLSMEKRSTITMNSSISCLSTSKSVQVPSITSESTQNSENSIIQHLLQLFNALPTKLLKPNAIVDLMHEIGRILPLNSYEADEYRGIIHMKTCPAN